MPFLRYICGMHGMKCRLEREEKEEVRREL